MIKLTYALPVALAILLMLFFSALPDLKSCALPGKKRLAPPKKRDGLEHLPILLITLIYALSAFYNLGDTRGIESFVPMSGETAMLELPALSSPSAIKLYCGVGQGEYEIRYSKDGREWETVETFSQTHVEVLKWCTLHPSSEIARPRYVTVTGVSGNPWLGELALLDGDGAPLPVICNIPELTDETELVPAISDYHNSSYFDEVYHARTAWEHLHGVQPYEISHPPLGKEIIGLGIRLFGFSPFSWRFMGTLTGVLMLPLLYLFLRKMFGGRAVPCFGTILFATDFMHYAQTRIATIDSYAVFFILLMYLFMFLWLWEGSLPALAACGLSFGLGAAAKWTSLYAGAGLGLIWAAHWLLQALESNSELSPADGSPVGPIIDRPPSDTEKSPPKKRLFPAFVKNCLFCIVFFILIPCFIYYLSYIPYGQARGVKLFTRPYLNIVLENQRYMFSYHSGVNATHPYSSRWYEWLLNIRPILYYLDYPAPGQKTAIGAFLNPVLCWGGLLSLFVLGWCAVGRRDRLAAFLLVGYLAELLPWVLIRRLTFAYHYFPSSLFLVLSLSYVFALLRDNLRSWKGWVIGFITVSALLFLLFFPVLNGLPVDAERSSAWLRWLPTWPL